MKKMTVEILAVVIALQLVACADSRNANTKIGEESNQIGNSSNEFQISESQLNSIHNPKNETNITIDKLIENIDVNYNGSHSLLSEQNPKVKEDKSSDYGLTNERQYNIDDGILMSVYYDKSNSNVVWVEFFLNPVSASKDGIKYYAYCADSVIKSIDPKNTKEIEDALSLNNISDNQSKMCHNETMEFEYYVGSGSDVLRITPRTN